MSFSPDWGEGARDATVEVKLDSRFRAESMTSLTLFSVAAIYPWKKTRTFPISAARRSVGVGVLGFVVVGAAGLLEEGIEREGGAGVASKSS